MGLKSGQDLENRAAHPHQEFPGVPSREAGVPTPRYGPYLMHGHDAITPVVVAMNSCFFLIRTHQHGERSRDFETRSLPCDHPPRRLLPRRVQKHWFTRQLHRREVVAVGWEPQNSSPTVCDGDGIRKIDLCAALLVIVRPLLQQARIYRS